MSTNPKGPIQEAREYVMDMAASRIPSIDSDERYQALCSERGKYSREVLSYLNERTRENAP